MQNLLVPQLLSAHCVGTTDDEDDLFSLNEQLLNGLSKSSCTQLYGVNTAQG